jgi:hypothetical protein
MPLYPSAFCSSAVAEAGGLHCTGLFDRDFVAADDKPTAARIPKEVLGPRGSAEKLLGIPMVGPQNRDIHFLCKRR